MNDSLGYSCERCGTSKYIGESLEKVLVCLCCGDMVPDNRKLKPTGTDTLRYDEISIGDVVYVLLGKTIVACEVLVTDITENTVELQELNGSITSPEIRYQKSAISILEVVSK